MYQPNKAQRSDLYQNVGAFNAINRGVYLADNLDFLRSLNDECIDLICIDPPFAKNDTFDGDKLKPPLTEAEKANETRLLQHWGINNAREANSAGLQWPEDLTTNGGYKDIWSWEGDVHEEWLNELQHNYEGIAKLIDATRYVRGDSTAAYICYMAIRLIEIHRVLKPTGSLYLHCDHTANAYLRQLLDGIFGHRNFRNEIIWRRSPGRSGGRTWGNTHDTILYYTKSDIFVWNDTLIPTTNTNPTSVPLTASGTSRGESGQTWNGYNPTQIGRHWGVPRTGRFADWIEENIFEGFKNVESVHKRLDILNQAGLIRWSQGGTPSIIRPPEADSGNKVNDIWTDIKLLSPTSSERTGYPTQKPHVLAERIIKASTNPNDIVLDCFAGCAYTAIAAEKSQRQWVACDLNLRAWTVLKRQFNKKNLLLLRCNDDTTGQQVIGTEPVVTIHGPDELPERSTPRSEHEPNVFQPPERKFKVPASIIPENEMLRLLLELSGYMAWCCGFANRKPDGTIIKTTRNFHLDHVDPKSRYGSNQITNRAPLCPYHNIRKGNKRIHLSDYRDEIAHAGEMMVQQTNELIDLAYAYEKALNIYSRAANAKNPIRT